MYSGGQRTIFDFPGKAKSEVWRNFGFYLSDDGYSLDRTRAICKYCRTAVRYTGNTTNLHTHFVNHHLRNDKHKFSPSSTLTEPEPNSSSQSLTDIVRMPLPVTVTFPTKELPKTTPLTYAIIEYFIGDMVPFTTISSQSFRNLLYTLDKNCDPPSKKHLEEILMPQLYKEGQQELLSRLEMVDNVTLTTDVWYSSQEYMTLSANFISAMWQMNTFVLQTTPLPPEISSEGLSSTFETLQRNWRIICEPTLVSGNEDILKAGGQLKWKHMPCFAETINNAAKEGLAIPAVQRVIVSARKLLHFFKGGPGSSIRQPALPLHSLPLDVEDRWISTFNMLQKIIEYLPAVEAVLEDHECPDEDVPSFPFDAANKSLCRELVDLLRPLSNASMLLCDQQIVTASLILPVLKKLEITLLGGETDSPDITECRNVIWKEIQTKYSSEETRDFLLMCSLLDPRYKGLRYVEPVEREKARRLLYDAALKPFIPEVQVKQEVEDEDEYIQSIIMGPPFSLANCSDDSSSTSGLEEPAKKRKLVPSSGSRSECDWLSDVVGHKDDTPSDKMSPMEMVNAEMDRYMKEKQITSRSPLIWWYEREKIFPNLSSLAKKHLSVMGTCKPPEQVFLVDKDVIRLQRSSSLETNLDAMIFLNKNYKNLKNQS